MKIKVLFMGRKKVASECLKYLIARTDVEIVGVLTDSHLANSVTTRVAVDNGLRPLILIQRLTRLNPKAFF